MLKERIVSALVFGCCIACAMILLVHVRVAILAALLAFFLSGGTLVSSLRQFSQLSTSLVIVSANALLYSIIFLGIFYWLVDQDLANKVYRVTARLIIPTIILFCLTCVPAINPLAPRGISELAAKEKILQEKIHFGLGLGETDAILRSMKIPFEYRTEQVESVVFNNGMGTLVKADAGDRVILARIQTAAYEFPCDYMIQIALVFGRDGNMKKNYIGRVRTCP